MRAVTQRRLAIFAAILVTAIFLAANLHFLSVAVNSQPACVAHDAMTPARRAC